MAKQEATTLNQLADNEGARKERTRVGRGIGSGKGKTAGKGQKGQKARSGVAINGFEGGQMPIYRRLPKRGFTSINRVSYEVINFSELERFITAKTLKASDKITPEFLKEKGIIHGNRNGGVKLLAKGELKSKLTIEVNAASKAAIAAVEKAGGKLTVLEPKSPAKASEKAEKKAPAKKAADKKPAAKKASPKADKK